MKSANSKKLITGIAGVAVLLLLLLGSYLLLKPDTREYKLSEDAVDGGYVMPEIAYQKQMEEMEQTYFRIQINARPEVDSSSGKTNLMIGNPEENKESVFVSVILDETGEQIFQSDTLKPGERNAYVTFDEVPDPGEYEATAVFSIMEEGGTQVIGEIEAGLIMIVE